MTGIHGEHDTTFMQPAPFRMPAGKHSYYPDVQRTFSDHDTTLNFESISVPGKQFTPSVFKGHQLQAENNLPVNDLYAQPDWILWTILGCLILLAWTQVFHAKRIRQLFRAPFSQRFTNQLIRDGNLFNERISLTFGIVYLLAFSLLAYEINIRFFGFTIPDLDITYTFPLITATLIVFLAIKFAMIRFLSMVFKTRETTMNYMLNLWIYSLITGPALLLLLTLYFTVHQEVLITTALFMVALMLFFRLIKGFSIGSRLTKFSYLFLFVYLCSLEILPLIIMAKLVLILTQQVD